MQIFSVILLSLCILIVALYSLRTNNNILKFDKIFQNHFELLKKDKFSLVVFIVVPIIAAISCANLKCITIDIINNINTALSVFIALQFSVVGVLCALPNGDAKYENIKSKAFTEIIFESILSVLTLTISFLCLFVDLENTKSCIVWISSFVLYALIFSTVLNIFIVLKRMYFLFIERK